MTNDPLVLKNIIHLELYGLMHSPLADAQLSIFTKSELI